MRSYIVTGATGDLGQAVVGGLLAAGHRVAAPYRSIERFEELQASLPGNDVERLWGDAAELTDLTQMRAFVEAAVQECEKIDGLASLAGAYAGSGTLERTPDDEWDEMQGANLRTAWVASRAVLPFLLEGGGSVVTVSAGLVEAGGAGAAAYAVSKAGVEALTRALALENRDRGVRFNCVAPLIIDTPGNRAAMPEANRASWTPPERLANLIGFLLSPDSAPLSGARLPVRGR